MVSFKVGKTLPVKFIRQTLLLILFSLSVISLSGCSYKLIPFSPVRSKIAIPIFSNQTFKYGLEQTLTDSIINEFISDGRLQLVGPNEADVILRGEIVQYLKETPSEVTTTLEENRIRIEVLVSLASKEEKKTLTERKIEEVFAYSSSEVGGIQTEDEAVEEACKEIAEKLIDAITWDLGFSPI
jgi:hypothetical protein